VHVQRGRTWPLRFGAESGVESMKRNQWREAASEAVARMRATRPPSWMPRLLCPERLDEMLVIRSYFV